MVSSPVRQFAVSRLLLRLAAPLAIAISVAACSTPVATHGGVTVTGSTNLSSDEIRQATEIWGQRYDENPKDKATILNFAAALRLNGQPDQAVAVLRKGVITFPKDEEIAAAYGKALAASGDFDTALRVIRDAQRPDRPDWKLYSAEGAILDQMGKTAEARAAYKQGLTIAPGEPTILNNLALSHLLVGELDESEKILRGAAQAPSATSRIRQNLALVLGLQGKFKEAEQVAASELDPKQAAANVAYLKSMLAQANTWNQIKDSEKKSG
ncbi:tetratricopeptide repeat protein [Chthonobacter albigriseus]|uniref:tetratricopeptide repeat protein n=1 Tax=Chthonobacter albigriseus TaxID=1683161 RepID=UPI0015EEBBE4|nr:tetratricopeptide repeat protein [Chthonobacter albigriseus]